MKALFFSGGTEKFCAVDLFRRPQEFPALKQVFPEGLKDWQMCEQHAHNIPEFIVEIPPDYQRYTLFSKHEDRTRTRSGSSKEGADFTVNTKWVIPCAANKKKVLRKNLLLATWHFAHTYLTLVHAHVRSWRRPYFFHCQILVHRIVLLLPLIYGLCSCITKCFLCWVPHVVYPVRLHTCCRSFIGLSWREQAMVSSGE